MARHCRIGEDERWNGPVPIGRGHRIAGRSCWTNRLPRTVRLVESLCVKNSAIQLAVADNDEVVLMGLTAIVRQRLPQACVGWVARSGHETIERALDPLSRAGILLLDMSLEDMTGTEACRRIREKNGTLPILAMTAFSLNQYAATVADAGAQGIVGKADFDGLCRAIAAVADGGTLPIRVVGERTVSFESAGKAHERLRAVGDLDLTALTERERQVVELYAQACKPAAIAFRLGITPGSVKTHLDRAQKRLGLSSRADLAELWWRWRA